MNSLPTFVSLHVASDLHLGGAPQGRQIFDQGELFASFVNQLRLKPSSEAHGLVLNGDLVDFLAEPNAAYLDAAGAAAKLDRIIKDSSFKPVWQALRDFVVMPNRFLIITLGNHDLELSLPPLRRQLLQELAGDDDAARGRITLAFEPEGFRAKVGVADVLCVHGNEVDTWNLTDYEQLRRIGRDFDRGLPLQSWRPNAGTKLVIDVMNTIKKSYAFVDLLKPETEAVLPTLLVLDPSMADELGAVIPTVLRLGWDRMRRAFGFLGEAGSDCIPTDLGDHSPSDRLLGAMVEDSFGAAVFSNTGAPSVSELLRRTEDRLVNRVEPRDLLGRPAQADFLGLPAAMWNVITRKGRSEVLRQALERVWKDTSFDRKVPDHTSKALCDRISSDIQFMTAGHTHLERAIALGQDRYYFNSGTWVRVIQLSPEVLRDKARFSSIYKAIEEGTMSALDKQSDLVQVRPAVVAFWADDTGTHGQLMHVASGGTLQPVSDLYSVRT